MPSLRIRRRSTGATALWAACALLAAQGSHAAPELLSEAGTGLSYHRATHYGDGTVTDVVLNQRAGVTVVMPDGSRLSRVGGCVNAGPGEPPCADPGLVGGGPNWWNTPAPGLETHTGAQARSDYGISRARVHTAPRVCADPTAGPDCLGVPGGDGTFTADYISRGARASAGYTDDFHYAGPTIPVTFEFLLHGSWSGGGQLSFVFGKELTPFGSEDGGYADVLNGVQFMSCSMLIDCAPSFDSIRNTQIIPLPGSTPDHSSGSVDQVVSWTMLVHAAVFDDEAGEWLYDGFASMLTAGGSNGAEVDAYNTATLQRILVPSGTTLSFGSGTAYNVQVVGGDPGAVPEPSTLWLLLGPLFVATRSRRETVLPTLA
jgi:hypothetical protein